MAIAVAYGVQAYKRADLPQIRLVNTYVEKVENQAAQIVLLPRPGLVPENVIGLGPINGILQQQGVLNGAQITVSGSTAYNGSMSIGVLDNTGITQIVPADNAVLLSTGAHLWRSDGGAATQIAFPNGAAVSWAAYLGGYSLAGRVGSRRIYFTLDTTTWDGLDYVSAEQSTAYTVGAAVLIDQLLVLCSDHSELFYLSGDADAPIQRVQGRVFDKGCRDRNTIVKLDNTVFWVGNDNIVYRLENTPVRISDHGIEERLAATETVSAWAYTWKGHLFYVLQMDDSTCVYDVATQQFHDLASYGLPRWRGRVGTLNGIVGDDVTGQLWSLADDVFTDGDDQIVGEFTAIIDRQGFLDTITLDCSIAKTEVAGTIECRSSRDNGETFGEWKQASLGSFGQTRQRVVFKRFGLIDQEGLVLHFRITDAVPRRITNIRANEAQGGRSRPT